MKHSKTNVSLLLRIRNSEDRDSWNEFASIYRPAIIRLAKFKGLQNADAEDLAQQVLFSVAGAIEKWQPDDSRASFRTWLNRITLNAIANLINRAKPDKASGNSKVAAILEQATFGAAESEQLTLEIRREVFRFAAAEIESEFHPQTWQAFWQTAVNNRPVNEVATELDVKRGSVYAARSRVMRRLKEKILELEISESRKEENDE